MENIGPVEKTRDQALENSAEKIAGAQRHGYNIVVMLMTMLKAWMMGGRQVGGKQLVFQLAVQQKRAQTIAANKRKQFEQRLAKF